MSQSTTHHDPAKIAETKATAAFEKVNSRYLLIGGLILMAMGIFFTTAIFLLNLVEGSTVPLAALFAASALLAATLMTIVGLRLWRIYRDRKIGLAGSRMHTRLVGLLSIVAIAPAVITFTFSTIVLQRISQDLLVDRINLSVTNAVNLANGYFGSNSTQMANSLIDLAVDVKKFDDREGYAYAPVTLRTYLLGQAIVRGWSAIYLIDGDRRIIMRAEVTPRDVMHYRLPAKHVFDRLDSGRDIYSRYDFNAVDSENLELYYGILKIQPFQEGYILAYKADTPIIANQLLAVRDFRDSSTAFQKTLANLSVIFLLGFGLLALIILLFAVWAGLLVSNAIVEPIGRLSNMANKVSSGDLSVRVTPRKNDGELGDLALAFNHMTSQLETQRDDLVAANQQSDERRRFIEAVLSGVPAGVMGVSPDGRITIANRTAAEFLGSSPLRLTGAALSEISAGIDGIFKQARDDYTNEASGQVEFNHRGTSRLLNVRVGGDGAGYVVTFDDITELVSAQRNAAWGDVARRIAHEIKNPLTPIQLSAERLQRKYKSEITSNPEIFERCTETIIRHVGDIGRMVQEFSSFARMPEPVMKEEDLLEIAKGAVFTLQVSNPSVEFEILCDEEAVIIWADGRLLAQACTNLIKNAVESITENTQEDTAAIAGKVRVEIKIEDDHARISVIDNGKGLPENSRHRLTEPYMTTRKKGTGLGLAIVRKVIEEHQGTLRLENDLTLGGKTGARVSIILPVIVKEAQMQNSKGAVSKKEVMQ